MQVLGIDPGLSGALALYDGTELIVADFPTISFKKGKKNSNELNLPGLIDLFDLFFHTANHAYVEQVAAMPGQGVSSMFKFGDCYGTCKTIVIANRIPMTLISPVKWKAEMGLNSDKEKSRARALKLFPGNSKDFARKLDNGRAEAALLAYFGFRMLTVGKVR